MEMKYLREQDTGQIYMPVVHASGIVGLDVSGTAERTDIDIQIEDPDQFITGGFIKFSEYSKMVFVTLEIIFENVTENDNSAYQRLLNGNEVVINVPTDKLKKYTYLVFDTVSFDENDTISNLIDTSVMYTDGAITIKSSLRDNKVEIDNVGLPNQYSTPLKINKVIGTAFGMIL